MTDGGAESGRGNGASSDGDENEQKPASGSDNFCRSIARIAVAQICESVGFQRFQESALEALTDIGIRYLREIGKVARSHANHARRTTCNAFDVVQGLEDLSLSHGFSGASDAKRCLACSGVVRDVELFVRFTEEIPFSRPVPKFPVIRNRKRRLSFAQIGEVPRGRHIPSWLPAFPHPSSYGHAPVPNEKAGSCTDDTEQAWKRNDGERLQMSRSQVFAHNGIDKPTIAEKDAENVKQVLEYNSCLTPAVQCKEKDALLASVASKPPNGMFAWNGLSMVEIFVPGLEAESSAFCDLDDSDRRVLPQERSPVNFRFQTKKKALVSPVKLSCPRTDVKEIASWFSVDYEVDDKASVEHKVKEAVNGLKE